MSANQSQNQESHGHANTRAAVERKMSDEDRLSYLVRDTLMPFVNGPDRVLVSFRKLYDAAGFASMPKRRFTEAVNDALSGSDECAVIGIWLFGEVEDDTHVFVRLCPPMKDNVQIEQAFDEEIKAGRMAVVPFASKAKSWADLGL